jgi:hypothetical protein
MTARTHACDTFDIRTLLSHTRALRSLVAHHKKETTYNLLAHRAITRDFLALRAAKFLRASRERLVEVVLLSTCSRVVVWVVHLEERSDFAWSV